jgi:hypothetical protein
MQKTSKVHKKVSFGEEIAKDQRAGDEVSHQDHFLSEDEEAKANIFEDQAASHQNTS